jgi:hypothetical protein
VSGRTILYHHFMDKFNFQSVLHIAFTESLACKSSSFFCRFVKLRNSGRAAGLFTQFIQSVIHNSRYKVIHEHI